MVGDVEEEQLSATLALTRPSATFSRAAGEERYETAFGRCF